MTLDRYGLRWGRWSASPGALFAAAALLYFGTGAVLQSCLLAAVFHELGHLTACALLNVPVVRGRLSLLGAELVLAPGYGGGAEIAIALAGPLANFFLSGFLLAQGDGEDVFLLAGAGILLGCFNLLPVLPLDGSRALHGLVRLLRWRRGEWFLSVLSCILAGLLLAVGAVLAAVGNRSLLVLAVWLAAGQKAALPLSGAFGHPHGSTTD